VIRKEETICRVEYTHSPNDKNTKSNDRSLISYFSSHGFRHFSRNQLEYGPHVLS